ncbi:MAG: hypothetical protein AMS19_14775 [Gemmatimonas sp. SG8_23]|jgi:hypothetical protein|nr:MAG: hypothetical protein AMS19_14775 [Gemmatimonas sp. SG8_23]
MGRQERRRERIASELFVTAVREEHLLRIDRGPDGKGEQLEFKEKTVEAIAEACVQAADKLISALDREPAG